MEFEQKISEEIFRRKYMINGEKDVDQVFMDVAEEISEAEAADKKQIIKQKFFEEMSSGRFIPGGRILANARVYSKMKNYNNCFTIDIEDSMEGIYGSLREDAVISSMGGGVGFDISKLRPEGAVISKGGESSGPLSFLKVFDQSAKIIHTGGCRRSAHIALMDVSHPDIEKFITIKQGDKNKELTQFNISVRITDAFIEAVQNNEDWNLVYEGEIFKTVKAKDLYDLMVKNAFQHNEPGIFNIDTVERFNNGWWAFKQDRVNPCFTGDTLVAVADGRNAVRFDVLASEGKNVPVYSKDENGKTIIKMMRNISKTRSNTQIVLVTLDDGSTIKCTPDHRFMMKDGSFKEAKNLTSGESLKPFNSYISNNGYRQIQSGTKRDRRQYRMIAEFNGLIVDPKTTAIHHKDFNSFNDSIENLQSMSRTDHHELHSKNMMSFNNPYFKKSDEWKNNFASHPGTSNGRYSGFTDKQIIEEMVCWIKEHKYPMSSKDWIDVAKNKGMPQYFTSFRKSLIEMLKEANNKCGFEYFENKYSQRSYRKEKISEAMINHKVQSVEFIGFEDVYDGTVDDTHNFAIITSNKDDRFIESSGVFVHNCGEICMPSYSLCCLGSNNLIAFVKNAFTAEAYFDFEQYKKSIRLVVRFLDNVLDRTHYPLKKIEDFSKQWRRIGLGFTGLGDALAMLGIIYGSDKSLEICEEIAKTLRDESYLASVELAREKGSFPAIDIEKLLQGNFINQLPNEIRNQIKKHGMRNVALNTCAPNGTISLSVGQNCSSGIEPIFSLSYDRNIRTGMGEETKKETVYDYAWLKYIEYYNHQHSAEIAQDLLQGIDKPVPKPDYFVTSLDVDPYKGVDVQAVFQKYIDHSISKTANLPMGFTYDQYKDLFMYAYKKGLKGFTSFNPEGCAFPDTRILTNNGEKTLGEVFEENDIDIYVEENKGWHNLEKDLYVYDENGEMCKINKIFMKGFASNMIRLTLEGGDTLCVTPNHEFKIGDKWVEAKDLREGDDLDVYRGELS